MDLLAQVYDWDNLILAYQNASRGKRGRAHRQSLPNFCEHQGDRLTGKAHQHSAGVAPLQ